jgi:dTDP-4-dehydrorhamnose reductase
VKILFTGASGFLGRYAAPRLAREHEVVGTYGGNGEPIEGVRLAAVDLSDADACRRLIETERPDCVVHAGAVSRPGACEENPSWAERINVGSTRALLETAPRLVFFSSDLVYDGKYPPYREADPTLADSVYARHKIECERLLLESAGERVVLRLALGYGWKPLGHPMFCDELRRNLRSGEGMTLFSDQFRSALYMKDAAEILSRIVSAGEWPSGRERLFNCGGPVAVSRVRFGRLFARALGLDETLIVEKTMAEAGVDRSPDCTMNSERLYAWIGYRPRLPEEGVADMARENPYK